MPQAQKILYNSDEMTDARLFESKLEILQEISGAVAASDNISVIANLMLELAINYTHAEKGSIMLLNEDSELTIFVARGIENRFIRSYKSRMGQGISGFVAQKRTPVLVTDINKDERFMGRSRDRYSTRSFICCPIVSKKKLFGVLNINDKKDKSPFTEDEFTLIKIIADQAAVALENALLMNQLKAKAAELEEINRKLIETDMVKTEFLTRISHELRTPLNSISGAIYYLNQSIEIQKKEKADFYSIISKETDKLKHIVENLLDFLRLEDETRVIKKSLIDLSEILNEVRQSRSLQQFLKNKGLDYSVDVPEKACDIIGDKLRVTQLFINMLEGIGSYLISGGSIGINIEQSEDITISLKCSGPIPEEAVDYLTRPRSIFKAEHPDDMLKLYLAHQVIRYHNWNTKTANAADGFIISLIIPRGRKQRLEAVVNTTMDMFIDFISEMLDVNLCSIMLGDELTGDLTIKSSRGLNEDVVNRTRIKMGDSIAGWVALEGKPLFIEDIELDQRFKKTSIKQYNTKSLISVPIKLHDRVAGVINLNNKKTETPFTVMDFFIANAFSDRISYFFDRLYSGEFNEDSLKTFTNTFEKLISMGRKYHKRGNRCAELMFRIMDLLGSSDEDKKIAVYVAMVYDLGLVPIDEGLGQKKVLSRSDKRAVKIHPYTTVSLLEDFEFSDDVKKAIMHHHEHFDGTGYPEGLCGQDIPLISRVLHAVDAYCAMTVNRPYRPALSRQKALEELRKAAGRVYDPQVVKAMDNILK